MHLVDFIGHFSNGMNRYIVYGASLLFLSQCKLTYEEFPFECLSKIETDSMSTVDVLEGSFELSVPSGWIVNRESDMNVSSITLLDTNLLREDVILSLSISSTNTKMAASDVSSIHPSRFIDKNQAIINEGSARVFDRPTKWVYYKTTDTSVISYFSSYNGRLLILNMITSNVSTDNERLCYVNQLLELSEAVIN